MDQPFIVPNIYSRKVTNRPELIGGEFGYPDGANTFLRHVFVVLTTGNLIAVASGGVLSCGLVLDASKTVATIDPPYALFGDKHFPVNLVNTRFAVSVTDASGNYGVANGAPQLSEVTIGESYGIIKLADGNHALNVDNTTNDFFTVVEKPAQLIGGGINAIQSATTYNPIVIVEIVPAAIQNIG